MTNPLGYIPPGELLSLNKWKVTSKSGANGPVAYTQWFYELLGLSHHKNRHLMKHLKRLLRLSNNEFLLDFLEETDNLNLPNVFLPGVPAFDSNKESLHSVDTFHVGGPKYRLSY